VDLFGFHKKIFKDDSCALVSFTFMMVVMTPEDKAMTEKSMQMPNNDGSAGKIPLRSDTFTAADNTELDAAGKPVEKEAAEKTDGQEKDSGTDLASPKETDVKNETDIAKATDAEEKKAFLGIFKKKMPPAEPVVSAPAVDPSTSQLTTEALASMVEDKLHKMNGDDFLIIKINKTAFFVLGGVLILSLWLQPLIQHSPGIFEQVKMKAAAIFTKPAPEVEQSQPEEVVSPDVESGKKLVRVRMWSDNEEEGLFVESLLREVEGLSYSIVIDPEVSGEDLTIAVRDEDVELQTQLMELFTTHYEISSTSAVLSADSDFQASILIGKNARK
jgi:hypothetical protein